jgi:hypothetical protein
MEINIYTRNESVKNISLDLSVGEYLVIQNALELLSNNDESPFTDRVLAANMIMDSDNKIIVDLDGLS